MSAGGERRIHQQATAYDSPWPLRVRLGFVLWHLVWLLVFRPTPKFFRPWRVLLLRLFGARVSASAQVAASARIKIPWHLTMEDHACLAPESEVYNLGHVTLRARCTIAQQAYLCAGTHELSLRNLPLVTVPIDIGADAFVGMRALILPGVTVGEGAVVGAGAVVPRDVEPMAIVAGNPAKRIGTRTWREESPAS